MKLIITFVTVILFGLGGYYGIKYYKIYSSLKTLMNNQIEIGDDYFLLLDKIFSSGTSEATEFIKDAFAEEYINAELIEINDSNLTMKFLKHSD